MKSILCFGEALIDFHAQASPDAHTPPAFVPHAGGAPANVAVGVARLGGRAAFIGMLAQDMFGDLLLRQLHDAGVDTGPVVRTDAANTALAFVSHDADGERSFSFYRPPAADLLFRDNHFDDAVFAAAACFHACSNSLTEASIAEVTLAGMARARAAGALVSFDMNLRPALWPRGEDPTPRLWAALERADVIKLSREEMDVLSAAVGSEDRARERLWQGHARLLVITDGTHPVRWHTRRASGTREPFKVRTVDSTGAGDAFVSGMLYKLGEAAATPATLDALLADPVYLDDLLRFAAACGALAVTRAGSFEAMPASAAVHAFLDNQA